VPGSGPLALPSLVSWLQEGEHHLLSLLPLPGLPLPADGLTEAARGAVRSTQQSLSALEPATLNHAILCDDFEQMLLAWRDPDAADAAAAAEAEATAKAALVDDAQIGGVAGGDGKVRFFSFSFFFF
jgi:hypothetical protein